MWGRTLTAVGALLAGLPVLVGGCYRPPAGHGDRLDDLSEVILRALREEERRLRRRFVGVRGGHSRRQVLEIMGHSPDWEAGESWGIRHLSRG